MHFRISDDLTDKIDDIFKHIEEKLNIGLKEWFCKSEFNYCLKTKIYKRTKVNKKIRNDNHIVPNKNAKYECKPLLQIQSIYYAQDDKKHTVYYPQVLVEECGYKDFIEYNIAHKYFMFTDSDLNQKKSLMMIMMTEMNNHTLKF